ncbi:universal stress protein A family protein [Nannizzia gypsea CBS 118893]|uniref:Universal stress protein A family protein n=1 Tax=Arthroderma gypseum (strain ATCC MYA-4604 / CBS 118893) TaxID=535722 RepID=E4V561_ARTGP|nr:universal stress protein A family protein [Nannizzia gypsea CBS 118893]EFR05135.1 universal stress protein A family protein [Nannizzia gypsea CBS 118893]
MLSSHSLQSSPATSTSVLASDAASGIHHDGLGNHQTDGACYSALENRLRSRSIQFNTSRTDAALRERSTASSRKSSLRRLPSPPPPSSYNRGVSFDTFDNRDATEFSLTLNYKHKDYRNTRRSRTFLCGTDQNDYSDFALEWLIDELVDDGDEVVCLRVVDKDSKIASDSGVEEGRYRQEAEKLLSQVIAKNKQDEKAISLVMELAVGKVQEIIQRMIQIYEPAVLIVGTRGRSLKGMQGLLPGSVSKYCLQQSPIPVIVVRPSSKREKKKQKRLAADPARKSYSQYLKMSEARGGLGIDSSPSGNSSTSKLPGEGEDAGAPSTVANTIIASSTNGDTDENGHDLQSSVPKHSSGYAGNDDDGGGDDVAGIRRDSTATDAESPLKSPSCPVMESPNLSGNEDEDDVEDDDDDNDAGEGDISYTDTSAATSIADTTSRGDSAGEETSAILCGDMSTDIQNKDPVENDNSTAKEAQDGVRNIELPNYDAANANLTEDASRASVLDHAAPQVDKSSVPGA